MGKAHGVFGMGVEHVELFSTEVGSLYTWLLRMKMATSGLFGQHLPFFKRGLISC